MLSLFGAYVPRDEPQSPRPLFVEIYGLTAPFSLLRGIATFEARVHAEDVAASASATACLIRARGVTELRVTFCDARGGTNDIVVARRRKAPFARSWTELSGYVLGAAGSQIATVQLRINWRFH